MRHKFVETIPGDMESDVLYISMEYCMAIHTCACGCGFQVVTPLSPAAWQLKFDGEAVSLYPSIGNWNSDCKSHYWIRSGNVQWAPQWSPDEIENGRERDRAERLAHFRRQELPEITHPVSASVLSRIRAWTKRFLDGKDKVK